MRVVVFIVVDEKGEEAKSGMLEEELFNQDNLEETLTWKRFFATGRMCIPSPRPLAENS